METKEELERAIWACNWVLKRMPPLDKHHPDYEEDMRAREIIGNRILKYTEKLKTLGP